MCLSPVFVKSRNNYFSCGKCLECRQEISRFWSFRLMAEQTTNPYNVYLTLTYADEYLDTNNLSKRDVQLFLKRLRKNLKGRKIKYFAVGEYGDKTFRPHYHLIMFNVSFNDIDNINKSWNKGIVTIDPVQAGSIAYVCGYVNKKIADTEIDYNFLGYTPPFRLMSKSLGLDFILKFQDDFIKKGYYEWSGRKFPIPRYFRERLGLIIDNPFYSDFVDSKMLDFKKKVCEDLNLIDDFKDYSSFVTHLIENTNYFKDKEYKMNKKIEMFKRRDKI